MSQSTSGGAWQFGFTITGPGIPPPSPGPYNSLSDLLFAPGAGAWSSPLAGGLTVVPSSEEGYIGDNVVSVLVQYSEFGTGAANCAATPTCARTLRATLGITYQFVPFAGAPGSANCYGNSVSALVKQFGGLNAAASAAGVASIQALQDAIQAFCGGYVAAVRRNCASGYVSLFRTIDLLLQPQDGVVSDLKRIAGRVDTGVHVIVNLCWPC
jgi:hypothetical protein